MTAKARGSTLNMAQREIISEGWEDYVDGKLSVMDIAMAAGVGYETTRSLLAQMSSMRRRPQNKARSVGIRRAHPSDKPTIKRPKGVTAQPFSDEWWAQNQVSAEKHFRACMVAGHWQFFVGVE